MHIPLAKDGLRFIIPLGVVTFAAWIIEAPYPLNMFLTLLTFFVTAFFRDPERKVPKGSNLVVSPADGTILKVERINETPYIKNGCIMVSIFMSVFNVHVNRMPVEGIVEKIIYSSGKFISAFKDKASADNEKNAIILNSGRHKVVLVQIAGLIARRIVCWVKEGEKVKAGARFGLIRFGSRVDIYLPDNFVPSIKVKDKVKAGKTILGTLQ
ncbi:MAG: phosphatidylserine decarboxylase family protein [Candidatus Schekmanbacteria bacterium]|nr:MAG: phosphatidylserine decarboxylase family protein [Candidatus Schekmanbacteria bacterium]